MRTLVIGDIHNRIETADKIMREVPHDQVVFVGDYFDSFLKIGPDGTVYGHADGRKVAYKTAKWLKQSLHTPNHVHLWGNHDMPYYKDQMFGYPEWMGWNARKHGIINHVMREDDWRKLKFFVWVDDWLISHAGFHSCQFPATIPDHSGEHTTWRNVTLNDIREFLDEQDKGAWQSLKENYRKHWFFDVGPARHGDQIIGGPLWLDWNNEFSGCIFNQIVGHTATSQFPPIRKKESYHSVNYCVDGIWGGCLVLEDGKPEIWLKNPLTDLFYKSLEQNP